MLPRPFGAILSVRRFAIAQRRERIGASTSHAILKTELLIRKAIDGSLHSIQTR